MREDQEQQIRDIINKIKPFVSPSGALIVLICFFLPWAKASCTTGTGTQVDVITLSGPDIGGILWLTFAAAIVILLTFFFFLGQGKLDQSKLVIALCALVGLASILIKYLDTEKPPGVTVTIMIGAIGTIIGLVLSLLGVLFLSMESSSRKLISKTPPKNKARRYK
ncbi:MAG: hypothetical protein SVY53_03495 [Chloroflexota bacterium]|nr:hypothetical protein [Chloroflexota bacterium]